VSTASNPIAEGVGHPEQSLSDVRRADAVCAQYGRPAGVTFSLQVCEYSIEPPEPNRALNLLAKDAPRTALADESEELGPEVSVVGLALPLARRTERLAGAGAGPHGPVVRPAGESQGF
jgi:hypothetical protein